MLSSGVWCLKIFWYCPLNGIQIRSTNHKLSLFVDDAVIYLSDPLCSLPHLMDVIHFLSTISGFFINYNKSEIYPIALTGDLQSRIWAEYDFKWVTQHWWHLGVLIALVLCNLFNTNFQPLRNKICSMLNNRTSKLLSWTEKIELIKSNIPMQDMFLFQTLPIDVLAKTINKWQKEFTDFVLTNQPHRVSLSLLP